MKIIEKECKMLNLQFLETKWNSKKLLEIVYGGENGNNAVIPAGAWGGFGEHIGQTHFWGRNFIDRPDFLIDRRRY